MPVKVTGNGKKIVIVTVTGPYQLLKNLPNFCYLSMPAFQCSCTLLKSTAVTFAATLTLA